MLRDDRQSYGFSDPGLWPSEAQELLLQAALWNDEAALAAWDKWRSAIDLDGDIDRGTFRLLPMLYKRMLALGVKDPLMQRLGSVYRWSWVESNQILRYMKPVLDGLRNEGVATLLLKGAPLAYDFYEYPGMRPMADFDVLVPLPEVPRVIEFLSTRDWRPREELSTAVHRFRHSIPFFNASEQEFDLHWHALTEVRSEDAGREFWANSVPFRVDGIESRRLDTTDSLIHAIVHGIRWNPEPPIRWIADAMVLINKDPGGVQWDRVTHFAERNGLAYRLTIGLRYLRERMAADVADDVLRSLNEIHITLLERLERTTTLRPTDHPLFGGIMGNLCAYQRIACCPTERRRALGFLDYMCYRRKLGCRRELGKAAAHHVWRWSKRRLDFGNKRLTPTS